MKNEPFAIFLTVLLVEKNIFNFFLKLWAKRHFFVLFNSRGKKISAKCGPFTLKVFNLMVGTTFIWEISLNYGPNPIFLSMLAVERKSWCFPNTETVPDFFNFFLYLYIGKKITAKVNAFMLPDGEVDLNFLQGGSWQIKN